MACHIMIKITLIASLLSSDLKTGKERME